MQMIPNVAELPNLDFSLPPEIDRISPELKILALLALGKAGLGVAEFQARCQGEKTRPDASTHQCDG